MLDRPSTKSRSAAGLRVAAVLGQAVYTHCLDGVEAFYEEYGSRLIRRRLVNLDWLPHMSVIYLYV